MPRFQRAHNHPHPIGSGWRTHLPMLIITLVALSATDRMTLERNHRPKVTVKIGYGVVFAFFSSGQLASAFLMVSVGLASKVFLAAASKKR